MFGRGSEAYRAFALVLAASPALGHENHQREQIEEEQREAAATASRAMTPGAMQETMEEQREAMEAERPKTFSGRLMSWLGRTHPFAVHFPIALFPVAWVALILVRRRGESTALLRAFVIVAGAAAVVAAAAGWFGAGFALVDRDPLQAWHRWIGTGLAGLGAAVALWAWRRASSIDDWAMMWTLGGLTLLLLVQGWLGATLVHGMDHMAF